MGQRSRKRSRDEHPPAARERDFEAKLSRADFHLDKAKALTDAWSHRVQNSVTQEANAEEPGATSAWVNAPPFPAQDIGLLVGDCLQCMRTSLDHLAFDLARSFTAKITPEIRDNSAFPILSDIDKHGNLGIGPQKWTSAVASELKGVDPDARDIIKGLQPYQRGHAYEDDPLWRLNLLNNIDKHRLLHVVALSLDSIPIPGPRSQNVGGFQGGYMKVFGPTIEGRTEIARWTSEFFPANPKRKMHADIRPTINVIFGADTPLIAGEAITTALREMHDHIVSKVVTPLRRFLK